MASSVIAHRPHSEEEWQAIKPIFLKLYIDEGKTLEDVRAVLSELYEFSASKKAFKSHITRWEAFKNYKASEKEMLAQRKESIHGAEHGTLPLQFRDRPIKWDRVERYSKARIAQRRQQTSVYPSFVAAEELGRRMPLVVSRSLADRDEILLRAGKDHYKWAYASWLKSDNSMPTSCTLELPLEIFDALNLISTPLKRRQRQGWSLLDKFCQNIRKDLESNSLGVLTAMLIVADRSDSLPDHSALAHQLFNYFRSLALLVLSSDHRFKQLLRYLGDLASLRRVAIPMQLLSSDALPNSAQTTRRGHWFVIHFCTMAALVNNHRYEEGRIFIGRLESVALSNYERLLLKNQTACIELGLGNYETAILQYTQNTQAIESILITKKHLRPVLVEMNRSSAYCHERQGNIVAALSAFKVAFNHAMDCHGQRDTLMLGIWDDCTKMLKRAQMWEELAYLQQQCAFLFVNEAFDPESEFDGGTPGDGTQSAISPE